MNGTSISNTIQHKPTKLCELCTAEATECAQTTECARPRNKATDIHMRQQTHKMDCLATRSRVISKGRDGWHCKLCELCTAETVGIVSYVSYARQRQRRLVGLDAAHLLRESNHHSASLLQRYLPVTVLMGCVVCHCL